MKLDHIGIAQPDAINLTRLFADLGLPGFEDAQTLEKQQVTASFSTLGGVAIELITPTGEESPVAKFLTSRGPGIHHLAFLVDDLLAERERLVTLGYRPLGDAPTLGAKGKWVQFFHPKETAGVLIELCQYPTQS
jgi:methylmalonyl-CoA epimerase